eukprot:TRINITY_DN50226_c0_g1_i9.p1 TRINITY_DN50226_c0_g1~~TRINITY_DN50226_c0_g1_i9.p1  ORF type:complete len:502 (+),score=57.19 TRINITY_DN50226_c0_g1_i9:58-1563(+)
MVVMGSNNLYVERKKIIRDNVHDVIHVPQKVVSVLDTQPVQRLHRLTQLGAVKYVYPSAEHSRFPHSIGVGELGRRLMFHLYNSQPELEITKEDLYLVQISGICHDLGHGPVSHAFENCFLKSVPDGHRKFQNWTHEDMSCKFVEKIFDVLWQENHAPLEDPLAVKRVQDMIIGDGSRCPWTGRKWMLDIISNEKNGIDVDKWDYLTRDSLMANVAPGFKYSPLLESVRAFGDEFGLCYKESVRSTIRTLMDSRSALYDSVYFHRKAKAIEAMLVDAMLHADEQLQISDAALDVDKYLLLDDSIFEKIRGAPESLGLQKSQELLRRIERRDIYMFCGEVVLTEDQRIQLKKFSDQEIASQIFGMKSPNTLGKGLQLEDIQVQRVDITQGKNDLLHNTYFYEDEMQPPFQLQEYEVMHGDKQWLKSKVRVYFKPKVSPEEKQSWREFVFNLFNAWKEKEIGMKGKVCSPKKPPLNSSQVSDKSAVVGIRQPLGSTSVRQLFN